MKILIAGDSWGKGEWSYTKGVYGLTHGGFEQYLIDDGHIVHNISQGAINQLQVLDKLHHVQNGTFFSYWSSEHLDLTEVHRLETYDYIFVFVTDLFRGSTLHERYWIVNNSRENVLYQLNLLKEDFLRKLNDFNVKMYLLGGLNKVTHEDVKDYKNIEVIIPSIIEFLLPHFVTFEVFFNDALNSIYSSIPNDLDPDYLDYVYSQVKKFDSLINEKYFSLDGRHPDREGHMKIYEQIKNVLFEGGRG